MFTVISAIVHAVKSAHACCAAGLAPNCCCPDFREIRIPGWTVYSWYSTFSHWCHQLPSTAIWVARVHKRARNCDGDFILPANRLQRTPFSHQQTVCCLLVSLRHTRHTINYILRTRTVYHVGEKCPSHSMRRIRYCTHYITVIQSGYIPGQDPSSRITPDCNAIDQHKNLQNSRPAPGRPTSDNLRVKYKISAFLRKSGWLSVPSIGHGGQKIYSADKRSSHEGG